MAHGGGAAAAAAAFDTAALASAAAAAAATESDDHASSGSYTQLDIFKHEHLTTVSHYLQTSQSSKSNQYDSEHHRQTYETCPSMGTGSALF